MKRKLPAWWLKWAITADEIWTRVGQSFRPLPRPCRTAFEAKQFGAEAFVQCDAD